MIGDIERIMRNRIGVKPDEATFFESDDESFA